MCEILCDALCGALVSACASLCCICCDCDDIDDQNNIPTNNHGYSTTTLNQPLMNNRNLQQNPATTPYQPRQPEPNIHQPVFHDQYTPQPVTINPGYQSSQPVTINPGYQSSQPVTINPGYQSSQPVTINPGYQNPGAITPKQTNDSMSGDSYNTYEKQESVDSCPNPYIV